MLRVTSGKEVGQLRGWHPHLGFSLKVILTSNSHAPEEDPETLAFLRPRNRSSVLPCLYPALSYILLSFDRAYVRNSGVLAIWHTGKNPGGPPHWWAKGTSKKSIKFLPTIRALSVSVLALSVCLSFGRA